MNGSLGSSPLFDLHRALINKGYADPACSQVIDKAKVSYLFLNSVKERENVFLFLLLSNPLKSKLQFFNTYGAINKKKYFIALMRFSTKCILFEQVPIIKMIDMSTKVKVDISLNNHSSIEKTELICVSTCSNICIPCTLNSYITGIIFVKIT